MKGFFAAILAILYFAATTGATIHVHYCMGKLVEKKMWASKKANCSKCGMEKSSKSDNGCCKEEQQQVKIEKEHQKAEATFQPLQLAAPVVTHIEVAAVSFSSITEQNPTSHAPPGGSGTPLFKRNCVFRI